MEGGNIVAETGMAKYWNTETANRVADRAVQIFGGRGYMRENVAERFYRELETRVEEVMTHKVVTSGLDESVERCLDKMRRAGCRHLPVVHDGRVIAMLSMRDLLTDEIEEQDEEIRHLRAYIQQAPVS